MICSQCHERDAVVHLTQIVENAVTQVHLCEQCAAERGIETNVSLPKHPLGDFLQAAQQQAFMMNPITQALMSGGLSGTDVGTAPMPMDESGMPVG